MRSSSSTRRVLALAALWVAVSGAALSAPACYGRNCEGTSVVFGKEAGQGSMVNSTTWQSSPIESEWLPFPRQQLYYFDVPALGGQTPHLVLPYLGATREPAKSGDFTLGSGNLTLLYNPGPNRIAVKNDSCSDYFLRLVVQIPTAPDAGNDATPEASDADASDADAGTSDAGDSG